MFGVEAALLVSFGFLLFALFSGYPVGLSLGGVGVVGLVCIAGLMNLGVLDPQLMPSLDIAFKRSLSVVPDRLANGLFGGGTATIFLAIPLFILMGTMLERSGVAVRLFDAGERLLCWIMPQFAGRTVLVLMLVAVMFAATSGVVGASVSALAAIAYPSLRKQGASPQLASGLVIAAGSLGQIIPPSVVLVILTVAINEFYAPLHPGQVVEVFDMFRAALIPGLLLAVLYLAWGIIRWPAADVGQQCHPGDHHQHPPSRRDLAVFVSPVLLIAAILGAVLTGFATLTDAAVFGVLGALALGIVFGDLSLQMIFDALLRTSKMWANIALILIGALIFTISLKAYGGDLYLQELSRTVDRPIALLALVLLLFFVLGFFLEFVELTVLLIPIFGPVLFASSLDPVWIGLLIGLAVQTSFLTPPMGISLFYFQAASRELNASIQPSSLEIVRGIFPFVTIQLGVIVAAFAVFVVVSLP